MTRPETSGAENGPLRAGAPQVEDTGPRFTVFVELENRSNQALWVITDVRGMKYDEAGRVLRVLLSDRELGPGPLVGIRMLPRFVEIGPGRRTTLQLEIPKTLSHLRVPTGPPQPTPDIEQLATTDAEVLEVAIGWGRTLFDPRAGGNVAVWEEGVVEGRGPMQIRR